MALNLDGTGPITGVSRLTGDTSSGDLILRADPTGAEADSIIGLEVDGTERARLDASGNLLIGGTLPASPNISLNANGTSVFTHSGTGVGALISGPDATTRSIVRIQNDQGTNGRLDLVSYGSANTSDTVYTGFDGNPIAAAGIIEISGRGTSSTGVIYGAVANRPVYFAQNSVVKLELGSTKTYSANSFLIGGTLPASPNISLNTDGSSEFADDVTIGDYANQNGSLILARGQGLFKREAVGAIAVTNLQINTNVYGFACGSLDSVGNTDYKALINIDGSSTFSGRLLAGTNTPIADTTTALVQSNSQVIAPQGVSTANGGWSMLATSRVTLTNAPDGINGHTVQINLAGINGNNNATLLRVSFAMRRGNSGSAFSQKSQYMGLWDATRISTDQSIDTNDIVTSAITVVGTTYVSDVITFTFNTDNVRSFTARAIEYCTTGTLYTEA